MERPVVPGASPVHQVSVSNKNNRENHEHTIEMHVNRCGNPSRFCL